MSVPKCNFLMVLPEQHEQQISWSIEDSHKFTYTLILHEPTLESFLPHPNQRVCVCVSPLYWRQGSGRKAPPPCFRSSPGVMMTSHLMDWKCRASWEMTFWTLKNRDACVCDHFHKLCVFLFFSTGCCRGYCSEGAEILISRTFYCISNLSLSVWEREGVGDR